ncbi:ABC transporter substrate-binding protein [Virgibacillus siamensis]|uniref:ABC transporter substrate-binding protein n=1 Tax=Virgibacillus siamensis TaxID=480071 RepID=UPI0009854FA3|nr:ABC transporter substrate-binding protein [Virgibacillus siamensis]
MDRLKHFKLAAFLLVLMIALVACSSGSGGESEGSSDGKQAEEGSDQGKVKLVYARGRDTTGATQKIVDSFNKSHKNIQVELREMPADSGKQHDAYVTMLNAKSSEIDVFDVDVVWPAEFAQAGYTLPLDRFIKKDNIDLSKYNQGALSAAQFNGKQWALPRYVDAGLLFYRKDLVDKAPETWDELTKQAKNLKGKSGTDFGYVFQAKQYEGLVCNAVEFIAAYGGEILDDKGEVAINSQDSIQGLKKLVEIANADYVPGNITTFTEVESETAFIEGESVFIRNWPYQWALSNNKEKSEISGKVGVAPLPAGDEKSAAALGGWMAAINKYSEHKQAAWEFLKYLAGPKGQKIMAIEGGKAPSYTPLFEDSEVLEANPFFKNKEFVKGLDAAVSRPVAPNYQEISEIIQVNVSKAIAGQVSVEQAVKKMEQELKSAVK